MKCKHGVVPQWAWAYWTTHMHPESRDRLRAHTLWDASLRVAARGFRVPARWQDELAGIMARAVDRS